MFRTLRETAVVVVPFAAALVLIVGQHWPSGPGVGDWMVIAAAWAVGAACGCGWAGGSLGRQKEQWAVERRDLQQAAWDARAELYGGGRRRDA